MVTFETRSGKLHHIWTGRPLSSGPASAPRLLKPKLSALQASGHNDVCVLVGLSEMEAVPLTLEFSTIVLNLLEKQTFSCRNEKALHACTYDVCVAGMWCLFCY